MKGGQAVGFGIVNPGTSSGLVAAAGLPGNTTGSAIAAGYVGEVKQSIVTNAQLTTSQANVTSLSLTPGRWLVSGMVSLRSSPNTRIYVNGCITTTSGGSGINGTTAVYGAVVNDGASTNYGQARPAAQIFDLASTTTVYLTGQVPINSSAANDCGELTAVRIA